VGTTSEAPTRGFEHPALFYRGAEEYAAAIVAFVEAGLAAGEPVLVAVPGSNLALLRDALGPVATSVALFDMSVAGRNPGQILPGVLLPFAGRHPGRVVRIVGEPIWLGRDAWEYPACVQHEALINAAFAGRAATILCPYDVAGLDPDTVDDARRTHPTVRVDGAHRVSEHYGDPVAVAASFNLPLPDPPADAVQIGLYGRSLRAVRRAVAEFAEAVGLSRPRVADLTLAANELVGNTMAHAGGRGTLSLWARDGYLVGQVRDAGHIADPLAGRVPVLADAGPGGRGLLLVNLLCDLVRIHTTSGATTIRIRMRIARG
jgi:anti-sigma regulatory factor (Ser/Thr protein kinase)